MSITDKTRKLLWGRSASRCAICKCELIAPATHSDPESVVGAECHIVSDRPGGPRYEPDFPAGKIDSRSNLLLLCPNHHKQIDDQPGTFNANRLREIKKNHEKWVSKQLKPEDSTLKPLRLRRVDSNIPPNLKRLMNGQEVLKIVEGAYGFAFDHDDLQLQEEVDLVSRFFDLAKDWGDILPDLETGARVHAAYEISQVLKDLERAGFWVFGGREIRILEGGKGAPSSWPIAIVHVLRNTSPEIIRGLSASIGPQEDPG